MCTNILIYIIYLFIYICIYILYIKVCGVCIFWIILDDCLLILRYSYRRSGRVRPKSWIKYSQLGTVFTSHNKRQTSPIVANLGSNVKSWRQAWHVWGQALRSPWQTRWFQRLAFFWHLVVGHGSLVDAESVMIRLDPSVIFEEKRELPRARIWSLSHKKRLKQLCDENPCDIWVAENAESFKNYFQQFKMIQLSDGEFKHWFHVWSCHLRRVPSWSLLYFVARSYYGTFHEMVDIWMSLTRFKVTRFQRPVYIVYHYLPPEDKKRIPGTKY